MSSRADAIANRWRKQYANTNRQLTVPIDLTTGLSVGTGFGKKYNELFTKNIMSINNDKYLSDSNIVTSKWQYIDPKSQGWKHNTGIHSEVTPKFSTEFKHHTANKLHQGFKEMFNVTIADFTDVAGTGGTFHFEGGKNTNRTVKDIWENEQIVKGFEWNGDKYSGTRKEIFENIINTKFTKSIIADNLEVHGPQGVALMGEDYNNLVNSLLIKAGDADTLHEHIIVNSLNLDSNQKFKNIYSKFNTDYLGLAQESKTPDLEGQEGIQSLNKIGRMVGGGIDLLSLAALLDPKGNKKLKGAARRNLLTKALGIFGSSFFDKKTGKGLMKLFPGMQVGQTLMNLLFK